LGHKNGFPVFDVDWNRDGRCLLSAGGDGSIRLWDTMAVGPFGEVVTKTKNSSSAVDKTEETEELIPGLRPDTAKYSSGAALAVYRGHAPSAPVWSVSFAPCGYYFASSGADATARIWTTDRTVPVRLLTGHSSMNVNCIEWHPNCNYVITGSDDKTARLWDVQSGRTVRLLSGCSSGVNAVEIDPSGRFAAVAEYSGIICLWDLGTGKKVTEFRCRRTDSRRFTAVDNVAVHALSFSACGTALATGGDDCCIRIWDIQRDVGDRSLFTAPLYSFPTRQTMTLDLHYTKRNLLLAAGKYVTPVPLAPGYEQNF
jgi:transcription initiation factor TFIID subunit 5